MHHASSSASSLRSSIACHSSLISRNEWSVARYSRVVTATPCRATVDEAKSNQLRVSYGITMLASLPSSDNLWTLFSLAGPAIRCPLPKGQQVDRLTLTDHSCQLTHIKSSCHPTSSWPSRPLLLSVVPHFASTSLLETLPPSYRTLYILSTRCEWCSTEIAHLPLHYSASLP